MKTATQTFEFMGERYTIRDLTIREMRELERAHPERETPDAQQAFTFTLLAMSMRGENDRTFTPDEIQNEFPIAFIEVCLEALQEAKKKAYPAKSA